MRQVHFIGAFSFRQLVNAPLFIQFKPCLFALKLSLPDLSVLVTRPCVRELCVLLFHERSPFLFRLLYQPFAHVLRLFRVRARLRVRRAFRRKCDDRLLLFDPRSVLHQSVQSDGSFRRRQRLSRLRIYVFFRRFQCLDRLVYGLNLRVQALQRFYVLLVPDERVVSPPERLPFLRRRHCLRLFLLLSFSLLLSLRRVCCNP